ncbi:prenyltransferase, partial [bacterium]|nr:prenyltransferase [bacterium]
MQNMNTLKGLFRLLRFELPIAAGICVIMGQVFALGRFAPSWLTAQAFLAVFCISSSILVMNDVIDIETDRVNAPGRPLPAQLVTPLQATVLSLVLLAIGLVLGYVINIATFVSAVVLAAVGYLYNRRFKKTGLPGNLMVSVSVGMTFIFGGMSVGSYFHPLVWLFGIIAALIDLGEEIAADAMDAEGDLLIGSQSLAIRYGSRAALRVSAGLFMLVILLTALPFLNDWLPGVYAV